MYNLKWSCVFFPQEKHWHQIMEGSFWSPRSKWHELSRCSDPTNRSNHHEPALQQTNQRGWHCLDASAATNQLHQSVLVRKQIMAPKTTIRNKIKWIPLTNHQTLLKLTLMSLGLRCTVEHMNKWINAWNFAKKKSYLHHLHMVPKISLA